MVVTVIISAPSSAAPRESFTVSGRVFEDGRWLDYADVEIYVDGSLRTTTTTSAIGEYSSAISISTPGAHTLRARASGVWSSQRTITITEITVPTAPIVEVRSPATAIRRETFTVSGRVYESTTGEPYPGTSVGCHYDGAAFGSAVTNRNGEFEIVGSIPNVGSYTIRANARGVIGSTTVTIVEPYIPPPPPPPEPTEAVTQILDFVVPESLPEGSDVTVRIQLRNTGDSGYLDYYVEGNPARQDRYVQVEAGRTPTTVLPGVSVWVDVPFRYFPMPAWDYRLTASNEDGTSAISRTIMLAAAPPPPPPPPPPPEPTEAVVEILDFVVPESLPKGSAVTVRILLRNTGELGYLDYYVEGNPARQDRYVQVESGRTPTTVLPRAAVWVDVPFRYFPMPAWDYRLTASNEDGTSAISRTITLGVVVPPVPPDDEEPPVEPPVEPPLVLPIVAGRIFNVGYWYEGLESWRDLETQYIPLKVGKELHLGPRWINDGNIALRGHVDLEITSPTGVKHHPYAVLNQDRTTDPNNGFGVQFAPLVANEAGNWSVKVVLTLEGSPSVIGDEKNYFFNVEEAPPIEPPAVPPGVPPVVPPLLPPIVPPEVPPAVPPEVPMLPPDVEHMTDRLKMILWILFDIKDEIRPIAIKANTYSILTVDLSTVHLAFQTHHRPGFAITVIKCTGTMELKIGDLTTDSMTIDPIIYPQTIVIDMMDFDKLYSRNAAQPGREAVLIIWRRE